MIGRRRATLLPLCLVTLSFLSASANAEGWTSATGADGVPRAGYGEGENLAAIMLTCEGVGSGNIAIVFGGLDAALPDDTEHTAVVSVDGIAFVMRGRLRASERVGGKEWVRVAPVAEARPMIDALKAGTDAEISTPAGRYRIGLGGSGRALAAVEQGC